MYPKGLKSVVTGIPQDVLDYLESNTKLNQETIKKLESEDSTKIKYMVFASVLTFIVTIAGGLVLSMLDKSETKELQKQLTEANQKLTLIQTDCHRLDSELTFVKAQLDSLTNK